jgi:tRNA threonylcarbamoyladenosine biosynthesis protein TsaE
MHTVPTIDATILSHSELATEALGRAIGQAAQPGDVVALVGDLGAGKTRLARGIAEGLGVDEPVTSPTFILVAEYRTARGFPLYHADCYRFEQATVEAMDIGLDELMSDGGVCVVEWADRIQALLPPDHLLVTLTATGPDERRLEFNPTGPRAAALLREIRTHLPAESPLVPSQTAQ